MKLVFLFLLVAGFVAIIHPRVLIPRVNYENSVKISKEESHDYIVQIFELLLTMFDNRLTSQGKYSFLTMKQTLHHLSNLEKTLAKVLVLSEKITSSLQANQSGSSPPYSFHFDETVLYLESLVTKLQDVTSILQNKETDRNADSATTRVVVDQMRKMEERLLHAESKGRRRLLGDLMIKMQDVETRIIGLKNTKLNPAMEFLLSRMQQIESEVREQNQWLNSFPYSRHGYNKLNPLQLTENSILYQLEEMQSQLNDIFLVLKDLKSGRSIQKKLDRVSSDVNNIKQSFTDTNLQCSDAGSLSKVNNIDSFAKYLQSNVSFKPINNKLGNFLKRFFHFENSFTKHITNITRRQVSDHWKAEKTDQIRTFLDEIFTVFQNTKANLDNGTTKILQDLFSVIKIISKICNCSSHKSNKSADLSSKHHNESRSAKTWLPLRVMRQIADIQGTVEREHISTSVLSKLVEELLIISDQNRQSIGDLRNDLYSQTNKLENRLNNISDKAFRNCHANVKDLGYAANMQHQYFETLNTPEINDSFDSHKKSYKINPKSVIKKDGKSNHDQGYPQTINYIGSNHNKSTESFYRGQELIGHDCAQLRLQGSRDNGVYFLHMNGTKFKFLSVYCDMETKGGGWTVIQRRGNFSGDLQDFNQDWNIYKLGFGRLEEEFWLGNENIHTLTKQEECVLRIELEDFDGNQRWAEYVIFQVFGEEQQYRISVDGYRGNAGDALADRWYGINLLPFSTFDKDNDRSPLHCGQLMQNGWWWRSCGRSLNGKYSSNPRNKHASKGVVWFRWRGWYYSLRKVEMKIRPQWFSTASSLISETERLKRRFRFPKAMP